MGYKETNDQWTEHDSNFNALLQSLSGAKPNETDIKISSLEQKSQSSKVRVHYKKFTRGKDLSRCTEKDLANIFGKRSLKEASKTPEVEEVHEEEIKDSFSRNAGSMVDYFKKKIPNFGKNNYVIGSNGVLKKDEFEEETYTGFGFKSEKKRKSTGEMSNGTPKKVKKEETSEGLSNPAFDPLYNNIEVQKHVLNTIEEEDNEDVEKKCDKKKKKKNREEENTADSVESTKKRNKNVRKEETNEGLSNPASDPLHNNIEMQRHILNTIEEEEIGKMEKKDFKNKKNKNYENESSSDGKKKNKQETPKNKKKEKTSEGLSNPAFDLLYNNGTDEEKGDIVDKYVKKEKNSKNHEEETTSDPIQVATKKNKKVKGNGDVSTSHVESNEENESSVANDTTLNVKESKKDKKKVTTLENNFEELSRHTSQVLEVKRKKKRNYEENNSFAIDNPNFDLSCDTNVCENNQTSNDFEVKRKKKKRKNEDSFALDNPNFEMNCETNDCEDSCVSNDFEVKRKKKRNNETDSFAIDNPTFNSSSEEKSSHVDNTFEVKRKKKKKVKESLAIDNPSFNDKKEESAKIEEPEPTFDLILNVTSTPCVPPPSAKPSLKRRKSVRFNDVNEERIIPNNEDIANRNELFDINSRVIENGLKDTTSSKLDLDVEEMSKKIDGFQAEIENDMNEAKVRKFIGEVGNPDGENEKLPHGTKLKFKYANFGKSPAWMNRSTSKSKSSYKHLIKGDIVLGFNNTNLHEIVGYGIKNRGK